MLPIIWLDSARHEVRNIADYISDRNEIAALAFEPALRDGVARLGAFPNIGSLGRVEGTREWIFSPNYIVVYCGTDTALNIQTILHTRRRYP